MHDEAGPGWQFVREIALDAYASHFATLGPARAQTHASGQPRRSAVNTPKTP
jgi:hypothetical protein